MHLNGVEKPATACTVKRPGEIRAPRHRYLATVHNRAPAGAVETTIPILVVDSTYVIGYLYANAE
jgi:hypothetical protein